LSCGLRTFGLRLALVAVDEIGADYSGQPFNCNPSLPAVFFHEYGSLCGPTCGPARGWLSLQHDCAVTQIDMTKRVRKPASEGRRGTRDDSQGALERIALALERLAPVATPAPPYDIRTDGVWSR